MYCSNCGKEFDEETSKCPNCGVSKNPDAEKICGFRPKGTSLFYPHELGYECPICGASDEDNLQWSEYKFFVWCKRCNLDIPSCLCKKYPSPKISLEPFSDRDRIIEQTRIFLECLKEVKEEKR
ncbi:hypothetical protein DRO97_02610 [Archaeoglobales archaeon]|nr:MAG: hypothetical protein DRO97_02610 [Archaeoglobales archaeon]